MGEDDAALFREAIGDTTPLADQNRIPSPGPTVHARVRRPVPEVRVADTLSDHGDAPEEFRRNGVSRIALRKLKNSAIRDSLDLHGNTVECARLQLLHFLNVAAQRGVLCVRIIHGKGINSRGNEAVLRTHTRNWLIQHPQVLAFCPATSSQGGSGAVLVLLKTGI